MSKCRQNIWSGAWHISRQCAHWCPTLCDPTDCSPPGLSVHGILKARILQWVAFSFSRGSSQPRGWTLVSYTAGRFFTVWTTREAQCRSAIMIPKPQWGMVTKRESQPWPSPSDFRSCLWLHQLCESTTASSLGSEFHVCACSFISGVAKSLWPYEL